MYSARLRLRWASVLVLMVPALLARTAMVEENRFPAQAKAFQLQLKAQILPYWWETVDDQFGGYRLADAGSGAGQATDKQLVSQSRMVWGFSLAHRRHLGDGSRDYLMAAKKGYLFLLAHFRDPEHGGYYWKVGLEGRPLNSCKFLYGESFVVYAFVEYYRASGDSASLKRALDLYREVQEHLYDREHGGWLEHAEADWTPLKPGDRRNEVEVVGAKSANAHLHWMEALAELYEVSQDPDVRRSLEEALRINRETFYPKDPGKSCFHRHADWSPMTGAGSDGLSYGHNVEFAWLMIRAQEVLGEAPAWDHFEAHLDHALRYGTDLERGGLYSRGQDDTPATDRSKVWWVQAEWMAALADAIRHEPAERYEVALDKLIDFVLVHQADPKNGVWLDTVSEDGTAVRPDKAHNWKACYHDLRGIVKFIDAFGR